METFKIYYFNTAEVGNPQCFANIKAENAIQALTKFERWAGKVWRSTQYTPFIVHDFRNVTPPKIKTITESLWALLEN